MKNINKILLLAVSVLLLAACSKDRYIFTMKVVKLNHVHVDSLPEQNLYIKVADRSTAEVLATTDNYPSNLTLPATYNVNPHLKLHLYKNDNIELQLWGEVTGFIASSVIDMDEYKIIYPIDMETGNDLVSFSVLGSWK